MSTSASSSSTAPTPPAAPPSPAAPRGWLLDFVLLAALWGSSFMFMREGAQAIGALPTAGVRVIVAALMLWPLLLWRGHGVLLRQRWRSVLGVGVLNSAIPFACFAWAVLHISTGLSSILNATVPLFGALVARVWLKDRLTASQVLGLLLGFTGVALLASDRLVPRAGADTLYSVLAMLACLGACLCYGVSASCARKYLAGLPALVTATGSQIGAALVLAGPTLWLWPASPPGARAWLALLAAGVLCTGVAYILYFRLLERAGPTRTLAVTFVIPVFANFYGVLLLGETITGWMVLCGLVVFAGTALSTGLVTLRR